ncbi:hypothetical protein PCANC_05895 [Puccinia coronata f. sp. avenae]|uniref:Uncharacterized protein n=1 Tax=Puccinia coronata f. sp. avenae TaxID=200324 RepID=A0A2N5VY62_9BASI|nr:hypothetical protein PCANC_05895 [Puccinia coronata f. sp. avenae]
MSSVPIHPNYVFPGLPRRTKRCASVDEHTNSERLCGDCKRRATILSCSSQSSRAIEWAKGNAILSKKQKQEGDNITHRTPKRRTIYTRLYRKLKAITCCSISSTLLPPELPASQAVINKNQSCISHVPVKPADNLSIGRHVGKKPLVMKYHDGQFFYTAESCAHCVHKSCGSNLDHLRNDHQLYGWRAPIVPKSVRTSDQFLSPVLGKSPSHFPPPIPWHTRPKPTRPFRPIGEYDEEIVELRIPSLPCSPMNKLHFSVSNQAANVIHPNSPFQTNWTTKVYSKSDGYMTPPNRLFSTFSEPTTTESPSRPSRSSSQKIEDIDGSNHYSLPTGEKYIFSSNYNLEGLLNFPVIKKTKMLSFPGPTTKQTHFHTRTKNEFLPTRQIKSWSSSPYPVSHSMESSKIG